MYKSLPRVGYPSALHAIRVLLLTLAFVGAVFHTRLHAQSPAYVQGNASSFTPTSLSKTVPFLAAQSAGNLNLVVVSWNDSTAAVQSVADTNGNPYTLAIGPTTDPGVATQSIYYAQNILAGGAGANSVTVTFSVPAAYVDVRIAEYAGISTVSPIERTGAATGVGTGATTSALSVSATNLLVAAATTQTTGITPGANFTARLTTTRPSSTVTYVQDSFTGANGALAGHTPDVGGSWVAGAAGLALLNNQLEGVNFGDARSTNSVTPPSADYEVAVDVRINQTGWGNKAGVRGRDAGGFLGNAYEAFFNEGSHTWTLVRWNGFSQATLGNFADPTFTSGTKRLTLRMVGSQISLLVDGVSRVSATDAVLTAGRPGIYISGGIHDGLLLDNYIAQSVGGVGGNANILEDQTIGAASNVAATATLAPAGRWILQAVALRNANAPLPDTVPPSAPASLTATAQSATQVALAWSAATDNVGVTNYLIERCAGASCTTFGQIGTSATTSFDDTTVAATTTYRYRVRATDAATNLGAYSPIASATTPDAPDTQAPTAPSGLTATAPTPTQATLGWTAATDNVGVTNYLIERCTGAGCTTFNQIGTSATTSFGDTTVVATTTYRYRVRATDAANNLGAYSNIATVTTPAIPDTEAPSQVLGLGATPTSATTVALSWQASTDNVGVTGYAIERCQGASCVDFAQVGSAAGTSATDSGLASSTTYRYRVRATDAATNFGAYSDIVSATTQQFTTIAYVQGNSSSFAPTSSSTTVPFLAAQSAGNLNLVVVSWNDSTATVQTVTDTRGHTYTLAVGPTVDAGVATQAIYYAPNILATAAGANSVTVTFNSPAAYVDLRVAEYAGISTVSPIERTGAATGVGTAATTAALSVSATNLLVAAASTQSTGITPGANFTSRLVTIRPSSIVTYVQDSFTGANGALAGHTPEIGGTWVAGAAGLALLNNQLEGVSFGDARSTNSVTPPTADYEVAADVRINVTGYGNKAGVRGRDAGGFLGNAYEAFFNEGSHTWTLVRWNGFSQTTLGNFADPAFTSGTKRLTLRMVGPQISLLVDGVSRVSVTDAVLTAGRPGIYISGGIHDGLLLDNYVAQSVGGVGGNADLLEDRLLSTTSSVPATATLSPAGRWILQAVAFRNASAPLPDVTAPSDPTGLTATPLSATQVALAWTASTDNVGVTGYSIERCTGAGCATFAQIGTSGTPSFTDTTTTGTTTYRYRVRATDAADNLSGYSNIANATTPAAPDTQAPTAPSGLTATPASPTRINLAWTAATDNVGVTNYLVERCTGAGCSGFGQIGSSTTTSYADLTAVATTTYRYRVRATDAANNLGAYSNIATATTPAAPDTQAPSQPTGLSAVATSSTSVTLSWTASTDNVGVTGYRVFRDGNQVGTPASTTFVDNNLTPSTTYSYRVAAVDAASNVSTQSDPAQATTQSTGLPPNVLARDDFNRPNGPIGSNWTIIDSNPVIVNGHVQETNASDGNDSIPIWTAIEWPADHYSQVRVLAATAHAGCSAIVRSKNDPVIEQYFVYVVGPLGPNARLILAKFVTHIYTELWNQVVPVNSGDVLYLGIRGTTLTVKLNGVTLATRTDGSITDANYAGLDITDYDGQGQPGDGQCDDWEGGTFSSLTAPANVNGVPASSSQIDLTWTPSTGPDGVVGYTVYRNGNNVGTTSTPSFSDTGLALSTSYTYTVTAYDSGGNTSEPSSPVIVTTLGDLVAPTAPTGVGGSSPSPTQLTITWTASTDNVGVTGYLVERCQGVGCSTFSQVGTPATTTFNDGSLSPATSYSYRVRARDAASNLSPYSNVATLVTQADTQAPTAPSGLSATATSPTTVNLTWTASTDNIGVTLYLIERCQGASCSTFGQVGTSATTSFSDPGRTASTSYSYRVRATDAADNLSLYSNIATAVTPATPDTEAPGDPTNLNATATTATSVSLTWTASTDNVAVTSYPVERCTGAACTTFAQIGTSATPSFSDTTAVGSTTYRYRVRAADAATNVSGYSNIASATTPAPPDTQAPAAPSGLNAVAAAHDRVNLSWTAATDNVGVTNYLVERCTGAGCTTFSQIGTSATTTFGDTTVVATTTYRYRVRATDAADNLSGYSNIANATTPAVPDTEAPSQPTGLSAVATSATTIALTWNASTDNVGVTGYTVERCQGAGCTTFAGVGSPATNSFNDSGLASSTVYRYRVRATDAANNLSAYSDPSQATTLEFTTIAYVQGNSSSFAPTSASKSVPFVAAQSAGNLNLVVVSWNDSTAAVQSVADTNGNPYTLAVGPTADTGVATQAIYYASNILAAAAGANTVTVTFTVPAAYADVRVAEYAGISTVSPVERTGSATGVGAAAASGALTVSATNLLVAAATTQTTGITAGANFTSRIETTRPSSIVTYVQDAFTGASGAIDGHTPDVGGAWVSGAAGLALLNGQLEGVNFGDARATNSLTPPSADYEVAVDVRINQTGWGNKAGVRGRDAGGFLGNAYEAFFNEGTHSWTLTRWNGFSQATLGSFADPTFTSGTKRLTLRMVGAQITLLVDGVSRVNITDAVLAGPGRPGLFISGGIHDGLLLDNYVAQSVGGVGGNANLLEDRILDTAGSVSATATLAPAGRWILQAVAFRNASAPLPDILAPSAPAALTATPLSATQVALEWTASTDNVGVTGYRVERCVGVGCATFTEIGTSASQAFTDSTASGSTAYSYRVRATDATNNLGGYSNVASATTPTAPDTQAPTAPSGLTASSSSPTQAALAWTAATDNIGVTGYLIERCAGAGCASFSQIGTSATIAFNDTGLSPSTTYQYRVRATDAADNLGGYSNVATAVTTAPGTVSFVQGNVATVATAQATIAAPFLAAQTGGNLNLIVVGWNDSTSQVQTIADAAGNQYAIAAGPTIYEGVGTQAIYYAKSIVGTAAGANTVTVTFTGAAALPNIRIAEYAGLDQTDPLVTAAAAQGSSALSDSGAVTTTEAHNLLVSAHQALSTVAVGSGFAKRLPSSGGTPTVYVRDHMIGPDETSLSAHTPEIGGAWVEDTGSITIRNNKAEGPSFGDGRAHNTTTLPSADYEVVVEVTVNRTGFGNRAGVRGRDAGGFLGNAYEVYFSEDFGTWALTRWFSFENTLLGFWDEPEFTSGTRTLKLQMVGSTIRVFIDGVERITVDDATVTAPGFAGLRSSGGIHDGILLGNFVVQSIASETPSTAPFILEDRLVADGTFTGTASVTPAGPWIAQTVALRAAPESTLAADLVIHKTHAAPFNQGQVHATYTITAGNNGLLASSGLVTVTDVLPASLTATELSGTGWDCTLATLRCTRSDSLAAGSAYPPITLAVAVGSDAPSSVTNLVTVSGGGEFDTANNTATDVTPIAAFAIQPASVVITPSQVQQFTLVATGAPPVTWRVDGIAGGSAAVGTISAEGLYTPPTTAGSHTITVTTVDEQISATAAVFVSVFSGTFTHHNDNARTGHNSSDSLTIASVTPATFGKVRSYDLDGVGTASPLYVPSVEIPGRGTHNVLFVATQHDSVYAFDADGIENDPFWRRSFIDPDAGITTASEGDPCCDPEIGIAGTPVIDPATGTLYVVAKTIENGGYVLRLHALDIRNGDEKFGGPVTISASVQGTGEGSSNGVLAFDSRIHHQRAALLLSGGVVYAAFGSRNDERPFHGWLLGYNASTLAQTMAFCPTPDGYGGGIWLSNGGPATDVDGNIFLSTGNGTFDAASGGRNYGNSILKLSPTGTVLDYFTPHDQAFLESDDADLGSAGSLLLPVQPGAHPQLLVHAGKGGTLYLVDRTNLGGYNPIDDSQIVQSKPQYFAANFSSPVLFDGRVYFGGSGGRVESFTLVNGLLSATATSQSPTMFGFPGATLAVSSNGNTNGIVWAIQRNGASSPAILRAYDATDLGNEIYNSASMGTRDELDAAAKFSVPLVAGGKVFVTTAGRLTIFGVLP